MKANTHTAMAPALYNAVYKTMQHTVTYHSLWSIKTTAYPLKQTAAYLTNETETGLLRSLMLQQDKTVLIQFPMLLSGKSSKPQQQNTAINTITIWVKYLVSWHWNSNSIVLFSDDTLWAKKTLFSLCQNLGNGVVSDSGSSWCWKKCTIY